MLTVRVDLEDRGYPIHIGDGLLETLGEILRSFFPATLRPLVIGDENTFSFFKEGVEKSLRKAGYNPAFFQVPVGEEAKELDQVKKVTSAALAIGMGRDDFMVALGGGAVGDLTGFCAASYMRGIPFVQVPTTLLAQVDSSVGGKVAVNHPGGKNLLGFFYQPKLVIADALALKSLPDREFRAGMMEVIKYGVIKDPALFKLLEEKMSEGGLFPKKELPRVIEISCRIKRNVVLEDEREAGPRMILNYGHTLGHAIEKTAGYGFFLHGEAVGIGMIWATRIAVREGLLSQRAGIRVEKLIQRAGFPALPHRINTTGLLDAMSKDKKKRQGEVPIILPRDIGRVEIIKGISPEVIKEETEKIIRDFQEG